MDNLDLIMMENLQNKNIQNRFNSLTGFDINLFLELLVNGQLEIKNKQPEKEIYKCNRCNTEYHIKLGKTNYYRYDMDIEERKVEKTYNFHCVKCCLPFRFNRKILGIEVLNFEK